MFEPENFLLPKRLLFSPALPFSLHRPIFVDSVHMLIIKNARNEIVTGARNRKTGLS
jgi:hypothetical protein